ncbi:MAG: sugar phosphate isomerase/epimerase [Fimbriimonadaceae bacterium]|nr:sugar phosphate isomerase/epimerase [Fimbriimonadaceae bacterium]
MEPWAIGVFTSVDAGLGINLDGVKQLGISTVQLHAPHGETRQRAAAVRAAFDAAGIAVTAVFCGFEGESYADIPTVKETVGLVPAATAAARLAETKAIADFTHQMGVDAVAMHIGFVPEDDQDPIFQRVVAAAQEVCDYCAQYGQHFHLETGQETGPALQHFFQAVGRPNLAINFDPANMILYGSGEPIAALKLVGQYVRSVHCKDANWAANPGQEWGVEMPLGEGQVGLETYLRTLKEIGYRGPLTIEREISGEQQLQDIARAVKLLETLRSQIL